MYCPLHDLVIVPSENGLWIVMNVFTRTSLAMDSDALDILRGVMSGDEDELRKRCETQTLEVCEIQYFGNLDGLLADPTCFRRDVENWPEPEQIDIEQFFERLRKHHFVAEDEGAYLSLFGQKESFLDRKHLGNFHRRFFQYS